MKTFSRSFCFCLLLLTGLATAFGAGEQEKPEWTLLKKVPCDKELAIQQALFTDGKFGVATASSAILVTFDGGISWSRQAPRSSCFSGVDVLDMKAFAVGTGCSGYFDTSDGGKTFTAGRLIDPSLVSLVAPASVIVSDKWNIVNIAKIDTPLAYSALKAFCAVNESLFFAISRQSTCIFSTDAGKTWSERVISINNEVPVFNEQTTCIRFTSLDNGMIVYFSAEGPRQGWFILRTNDNGKTWSRDNITPFIAQTGRPLVSRDGMVVTIVPVFGQGDIVVLKKASS